MKLYILLFNKSSDLIEEIAIKKPKTYYDLLDNIKIKIKYLPKYYEIYFPNDNKNIIINNNENYKLIKNIIFIYEVNNLEESIFSLNYNKLSKSELNIIDGKYTCNICREIIKEDKPLLCYQCQEIYHKKCLRKWDNVCKSQNNNFNCPKCKYELPLDNWKEKVNYAEERNNETMNDLNINKIKDNKINKNQYNALKNEYQRYMDKISKIFERILKKCNEIVSLLNINNNIKNNDKKNNPNDIYNMIFDNLIIFENYVKYQIYKKKEKINDINNYMANEINCIYVPKDNENEISLIHDYQDEYQFSIWDEDKILKKAYLETKEINTKIFKENTKLYINDKKVKFDYKIKVKDLKEIKVRFKFKKVLINTSYMFYNCSSLKSIDLSLFNTINVINMSSIFKKCSSLESINLSSFYTTNVTNMREMFSYCSSLKLIDLSSFNTSNVTDMHSMFYSCSSLESIDLSSFNTNNVKDMGLMFCGCSSLISMDLSSFNTNTVKDMNCMFNECSSLKSLDLSSFNSNNVSCLRMMFCQCSSLESIDLSSFNITSEKKMSSMFSGCSSLKSIELSSFNPNKDNYIGYIFKNCSSLKKDNIKIKDQNYNMINLIFH